MKEDIQKILEYGVMAPSGDNSQPWHFSLDKNVLHIYNIPTKDNPYLNYKQSGSLIAHGALLKNIETAAQEFGYTISEELFPGPENEVARLTFTADHPTSHDLFESIARRHTNRKPYRRTSIPKHILLTLQDTHSQVDTTFITDPQNMHLAASGGSAAEIVILENKTLHNYLFKDVVWTKRQNALKKSGLYIRTMEFNPIQKILFFAAQYWALMKIAIAIGFPTFIAKEDTKLYSTGGAMGIISTENPTPTSFIAIGKEMQRIWLEAEKAGLSFQPVSATLYFNYRARNNEDQLLTPLHRLIIKDAYQKIMTAFNLSDKDVPLMMFRIGYADKASAKTLRKKALVESN